MTSEFDSEDALREAVEILSQGGVVACPTETLVGLLADATSPAAVRRVAQIKGRAEGVPIAVLLPERAASRWFVASLGELGESLANAHWPGPLTLVAPAKRGVAPGLALSGKVGMRVPSASLCATLTKRFGKPLTATSANLSGEPSVANTAELSAAIRSGVDMVLEGVSPGGPPSTVVDVTGPAPVVLRPGAISLK